MKDGKAYLGESVIRFALLVAAVFFHWLWPIAGGYIGYQVAKENGWRPGLGAILGILVGIVAWVIFFAFIWSFGSVAAIIPLAMYVGYRVGDWRGWPRWIGPIGGCAAGLVAYLPIALVYA